MIDLRYYILMLVLLSSFYTEVAFGKHYKEIDDFSGIGNNSQVSDTMRTEDRSSKCV